MEPQPSQDHYDYPTEDPEACEGHIGHLTSAQQAKLQDLRSALAQEGYTSRLDTLTLVRCPIHSVEYCDIEAKIKIVLRISDSFDSCEPEVSIWTRPRKCEPTRQPLSWTFDDDRWAAGGSKLSSGGKNSSWTKQYPHGSSRRRERYLNTMRSTTTKRTRYICRQNRVWKQGKGVLHPG